MTLSFTDVIDSIRQPAENPPLALRRNGRSSAAGQGAMLSVSRPRGAGMMGASETGTSKITDMLNAATSGDVAAQDAAYAMVYDELKRCARRQGALAPASSLTPTALVSELYLKLRAGHVERIESRRHFFALAARAMRQIMIDYARQRGRAKRGGGAEHVEIDAHDLGAMTAEQTLDLDAALSELSKRDAGLAQVVEWHFFAGLSLQDIAREFDCTERAVRRDWELARAYLRKSMGHGHAS
jgi:RNA polymerase sigma factor (TIGR02999 family)